MGEQDRKRSGGERGGQGGGGVSKKAKYWGASGGSSGSPAIPTKSGLTGVLITCDTHFEQKACREAMALIEEHYDKLLAVSGVTASNSAAPEGKSSSRDISELLAQEVEDLKDRKQQRFKSHNVDVRGCTFVIFPETPGPSALEVVLSILREAQSSKVLRARHCHRLLPITHACFCSLNSIKETAPKALSGHFRSDEGEEGVPFAVEYEHRSSDKFDRMEVIDIFAGLIKSPPHKVDLSNPVKTIIVQLIRNACGMSVVTDYKELAKFNIRKLTEIDGGKKQGPEDK